MPAAGRIKTRPEDFVVDEIPAYEPSGEGSHLFVHFRKKGVTTDDVVGAFARELGIDRRDIGVAGLKDKAAVTTQWISLPASDAAVDRRVMDLAIEGVEILEAKRHNNKLRTGHLRGNRFDVTVRGVEASKVADTLATLAKIGREGIPNAFGKQRFGKFGDTAERARSWLTGKERAPGDPRLRRFHFSALQSQIFNAVLEARVASGHWNLPLHGDLLKKEETGGIFVCTDVQLDTERALRAEVCPTGPIVGDRMRQPESEAFALEQRIMEPLIEGIDLRRARSLGEGTRRALRLAVTELSVAEVMKDHEPSEGCIIQVRFVLPKGAYATTVLSNAFEVFDVSEDDTSQDGSADGSQDGSQVGSRLGAPREDTRTEEE